MRGKELVSRVVKAEIGKKVVVRGRSVMYLQWDNKIKAKIEQRRERGFLEVMVRVC